MDESSVESTTSTTTSDDDDSNEGKNYEGTTKTYQSSPTMSTSYSVETTELETSTPPNSVETTELETSTQPKGEALVEAINKSTLPIATAKTKRKDRVSGTQTCSIYLLIFAIS